MDQLYLYVALIGVGFVLFALTRTKAKTVSQATGAPQQERELKMALDEFMNGLEEENARLLDSFTRLQVEYKQQFGTQQQQIEELIERVAELEGRLTEVETQPSSPPVPEPKVSTAPTTVSGFAFNEKYARVAELIRQGQTPEQIARFTGIGIGEIQMVIGLSEREES
ncbi:hypothetical protein OS242_01005 [Tumebacillus sp. DT12]|uniref:DUF2802 domain-containing protein n=1 Tax=Tumebacillus lacus TaxID=2995335 RepID=A0ABT3WV51_9BACL|nr:hypothetical protein [Tumebacillus lacus]MCX7568545.1 hypothetical protein [Tumebacillus lacus]